MESKNFSARELTLIISGLNVCHLEKCFISACTLNCVRQMKFCCVNSCENAHVLMTVIVCMSAYLYVVKAAVTYRHMNKCVNIYNSLYLMHVLTE